MPPELTADLHARLVCTGEDRLEWLRARATGITATDAARLSGRTSVPSLVHAKLWGTGFGGSAYTDYGRRREPVLAEGMRERYGIAPNHGLYRSAADPCHLATPDGIGFDRVSGRLLLGEIKTSTKPFTHIPRNYLRQIWWQQHVLGATRSLLVWEQHHDFVPVAEPVYVWVDRDEEQIARLVELATEALLMLRRTSSSRRATNSGPTPV